MKLRGSTSTSNQLVKYIHHKSNYRAGKVSICGGEQNKQKTFYDFCLGGIHSSTPKEGIYAAHWHVPGLRSIIKIEMPRICHTDFASFTPGTRT
jgi:hypothetical protein